MLAILNLMHFCINLTINTSLKKNPSEKFRDYIESRGKFEKVDLPQLWTFLIQVCSYLSTYWGFL